MRYFPLVLVLLLLFSSCGEQEAQEVLKGRIATYNHMTKEYSIYIDSKTPVASFKIGDRLSGIDWLSNKDEFLSSEEFPGITEMDFRIDIVRCDLSGLVKERIYKSEKGEIAWPLYSSKNDKHLLLTTHHRADPKVYPFEGLTPMLTLVIMDLEKKTIIHKIDSIGRSPNFKVEESPWLYSGDRFVYSIDGGVQLRLEGQSEMINPVTSEAGVYIFDLNSKSRKLLVPGAHTAIASPTKNLIAYQKDNSIRVLDMFTNEETVIYEYSPNEQILGMHWTPDGEYIYFAYKHPWGIWNQYSTGEKLIQASSGDETPFEKIGHGFHTYSWR